MRRLILILASLLVSGVFLRLALQGVPLQDVGDHIRQANLFWIIVSFGLVGVGLWTRGVRWSGLVGFRIPAMRGFYLFSITMFINLLPLRAGEVVRSLLATRYGVPLVTAAASIIIERLIDVVAVVVVLSVALAQVPDVPPVVSNTMSLFAVAAIAAFVVLILFARFPAAAHKLLVGIENRFGFLARFGLRKRLEEVLDGLRPLTHWRSAGHALWWTGIGWGVSLLAFYALELGLGVSGANLWLMSALSITLASFGAAIPVTVASIGPFQGAVRLAGEMVRLDSILAASLGIVFHGVTVLGYVVFGSIGLLALGVSFGDLIRRADAENAPLTESAD